MYGQPVKNKYPSNKNILKYIIYSLTGVCIIYYHFKIYKNT
jgi:hypothetical protein